MVLVHSKIQKGYLRVVALVLNALGAFPATGQVFINYSFSCHLERRGRREGCVGGHERSWPKSSSSISTRK